MPTLLELDEHALSDLFSSFTTVNTNRHNDLMLYLDKMNNESNHPGFTYQYHYQHYVEQIKDPYSYTQFLEHYHRKYPAQKGSMKIDHIAGEEMFIDFAGKKLQIIDRATGELMDVEVFVAILPCSHYTFVQACLSQKKEELILIVLMPYISLEVYLKLLFLITLNRQLAEHQNMNQK